MRRIAAFLSALVLSLAVGLPALAQIPISQLPSAPTPPNPAAVTIVSVGTQSYKAGSSWLQAFLSAAPTASLATYAQQVGVTLCTGDGVSDQLAINAAYTAMAAARNGNGLYVYMPPCLNYQTTGMLIANRGGWFATPGSVMIKQLRASASATPTSTISLDNPYDTNWVISGLILNGGWNYGRSPYSGSPNSDPWLDTEHALNITNEFAGVNDALYATNNPTGVGWPSGVVENIKAVNYGGDCFHIVGAGGSFYSTLQGTYCGGYGLYLNQYDSHFYGLDLGPTGRSGIYFGGAGSDNQLTGKVWFNGYRQISGDNVSLNMQPYASSNVWDGALQDSFCDAILDAGQGNSFRGTVGWAGNSNANMCSNLAIYKDATGVVSPRVDLTVISNSTTWPKVTYLINDAGGTLTQGNFVFTETGMPTSTNFGASWLAGTIAFNNLVTIDGSVRSPRSWIPGPNFNNTGTILPWTAIDSVQGGPIGVTVYPSSNFVDMTVGTGGLCVRSSLFSTPCAIAVTAAGAGTFIGTVVTTSTTFAGLPGTPLKGTRGFITDDNSACTFGTIATGGGSTGCPVVYDGLHWVAG